jgi:Asp-tRNA(Asn)/Glu-tRNA(Gln) amidotransferase A subunit family amidase
MAFGIAPLADAFRRRSDTPAALLERLMGAAERAHGHNAFVQYCPNALSDAEASTARFALGKPLGPLDGIPLAIKDCVDVAGVPNQYGTGMQSPAPAANAPVVERLRQAGAVLYAKSRMHELGLQTTGINPKQGTPRNPWGERLIPGGSSSGSSVAVASGLVPAALGTDAGGSVRIPAALNGLVGLKPTRGAVPEEGIGQWSSDIHQPGPIAWTVDDASLLFEAMAHKKLARRPFEGRIAVLSDFMSAAEASMRASVRAAALEVFGRCEEVSTPLCRWAVAVEFVTVAGALKALKGELAPHLLKLGPDSQLLLQLAWAMPESDAARAARMRLAMQEELDALFQTYDILLAPTSGIFAFPISAAMQRTGLIDNALLGQMAACAFVANLTGHPACTVPCRRDGLPSGLQLIGRVHQEELLLDAARKVEAHFGPRRPPGYLG